MDKVKVWKAKDGWRWKRLNGVNGKQVSDSSEGYENLGHAKMMAAGLNPGCEVVVEGEGE